MITAAGLAILIAIAFALLSISEAGAMERRRVDRKANMEAHTANYLELLGLKVRDRVTGFQGIVESISWDLYGCIQAVVRPPVDDKGAMPDGKWCDVLRLEVLDGAPVMPIPGGFRSYGPAPMATRPPNGPAEKPAR